MKVICDSEGDGLEPTKLWCIVAKDRDTGEIFKFVEDEVYDDFPKFVKDVELWIGHNFIGYDAPAFNRLLCTKIKIDDIRDTLILSRLYNPVRNGGHSLARWGIALGIDKPEHNDWSQFSPEMLRRCKSDVEINYLLDIFLQKYDNKFSKLSRWIEHHQQHILNVQKKNGFKLNEERTHKLFIKLKSKADTIEEEIQKYFPPRAKFIKRIIPRMLKSGESYSSVGLRWLEDWNEIVGGEFSSVEFEEFNLGSTKQKVERLKPWWKPTDPTPGGSWKINETNLATIKDEAPEAIKKLAEWQMLTSRWKLLREQWLDNLGKDGRVHGTVFSIGAITHRASHSNPNMGNPVASYSPYGKECRTCWVVDEKNWLVGTDATGIQLRILAHHINSPEYTNEVIEGDIHTKHMASLGSSCKERDHAKTFIYAWLLGAGNKKVASILHCSYNKAVEAQKLFLKKIPGLKKLKQRASIATKRGFYRGLDGRKIPIKAEHYALSVFLQGDEQSIMKYANILWQREVRRKGIEFKQVAWVHDEWQTEVIGTKEDAEQLGRIQVQALVDTGIKFKMNVPLNGKYKIGKNWSETH